MTAKHSLLMLCLLGLLSGLSYLWWHADSKPLAPNVTFTFNDGKKINLIALRGKPVLITFWATTCTSCVRKIPELTQLYTELHPQGLELIAVAMPYDRPDFVLDMIKDKAINYPISFDIDSKITHAFGDIKVTPTTFLVGPDGRVQQLIVGEMNIDTLRKQIHPLLIQPQV